MKHAERSIFSRGWGIAIVLLCTAGLVFGQRPVGNRVGPGGAPAAAPGGGGGSDVMRIRKMTPTVEKTPQYKLISSGQANVAQKDWGVIKVEYDTSPEWIDELEFTYYIYVKDQSNRGAPLMFRGVVTYVNIPSGRQHISDIFLHPNVMKRFGKPDQWAVVVKMKGAVIARESSSSKANWWEEFTPVDGVLLNRAQTPFSILDYDNYEAIKSVIPR